MLDMTKLAELHRERYNNVRIVGLDPTQEGDGPIGSFERFCRYGSLHFPKGRSRLNESQMYNGQSAYVTETKNHWAIRIPRLSSNCAGGQRCNQKKKNIFKIEIDVLHRLQHCHLTQTEGIRNHLERSPDCPILPDLSSHTPFYLEWWKDFPWEEAEEEFLFKSVPQKHDGFHERKPSRDGITLRTVVEQSLLGTSNLTTRLRLCPLE